jgi:acyl carrier protein
MSDIESWACHYVGRIDPSFAQLSEAAKLEENLFTSGRLDSMGLMNLLLEAETEYGFSFTPEAFQDRRLQTIFGLAAVIRELKGAV